MLDNELFVSSSRNDGNETVYIILVDAVIHGVRRCYYKHSTSPHSQG